MARYQPPASDALTGLFEYRRGLLIFVDLFLFDDWKTGRSWKVVESLKISKIT